jgi:hypothetical protein
MGSGRLTRAAFAATAAVLAAAAIEAGAALTTHYLVGRGWMAEIPSFSREEIASYFAHRDPLRGWTSPLAIVESSCVSAYGDSFTAGSDGTSYPEELGRLIGCDVANYGVGGYGSDQALLLARDLREADRAPVSVIAHVSENILRNLNQYRNLLYPGQELFFKPRFIRDGASLRLLDAPIARPEDFQRLTEAPEALLTYDVFVTRPRRDFPYAIALWRWLLADFHLRSELDDVPRHAAFYAADHAAGGLQLTAAILSTFAVEKQRAGRTGVVLLIPTGDDFLYAQKTGRWSDQALADGLRTAGNRVVHAGPAMLAQLAGEDPCHLFGECNSHFNARGYRMLAAIVADAIKDVAPPRRPAPGNP